MNVRILVLLTVGLLALLPATGFAAEPDSSTVPFRITLTDGSLLLGTITHVTSDSVFVRTANGIAIALPRSAIKSTERLRGTFTNGEYVRTDPNNARLLIGPTARPLKAGTGYIAAYEIFFTYGAVGVTDFLTLGGGLTLLPGASAQVFYFAPKLAFTLPDDRLSIGGGALYMNTTWGSTEGIGIVYGATTYGGARAGLTVGLGYGYAAGEFADDPVILVGGEAQVGNSVKFISENWFPIGSDVSLLSLGIRFFGDNIAGDFGFFYPYRRGSGIPSGFPFIPWLGIVYNFGHEDPPCVPSYR